jgi:hypothetical protein
MPLSTKVRQAGEARLAGWAESVVEKDLIDDEGKVVLCADAFEGLTLGCGGEVAGGIVRVDDDDGAGARGDRGLKRVEVDGPAIVIEERVLAECDVVEAGDEVEEWVTGAGDQDLVVRVAEEPEEEAVGLAGAGGEAEAVGRDRRAEVGIVGRNGLTRGEHSQRVGVVVQRSGVSQRREQIGVVGEAAVGGIGDGEVDHGVAGGAMSTQGRGERVFGEVPGCSAGEGHAGSMVRRAWQLESRNDGNDRGSSI